MLTYNHDKSKEKPFELNLTELQKAKLNEIRKKRHQENEILKKKISECQEKMIAALHADPVDKLVINQCLENISSIQKEIQKNTIDEIIQVKKHLDPHQCNCLVDELHAQMKQSSKSCTMECCNPKPKGDN
jgi:Spy/CpxP family protein refolding chaperone